AADRRKQTGQGAQGRRLAGAVGADQGDDGARVDRERDALDSLDLAVGDAEVLDLEQRSQEGSTGRRPVPSSTTSTGGGLDGWRAWEGARRGTGPARRDPCRTGPVGTAGSPCSLMRTPWAFRDRPRSQPGPAGPRGASP